MFAAKYTLLGVAMTGAFSAHQAFADAGPFDGLYSGTSVVTTGTAPVCGSAGDIAFSVADSKIDFKFGDFPLKSKVSTDGHFRNVVHVGKKGRRMLRTRGTIVKDMLEADLRSRDFTGDLCSYHWSLRRQ